MRAFSTANGGVMFIPDEVEHEKKPVSYKTLIAEAPAAKTTLVEKLFGRKKEELKEAA